MLRGQNRARARARAGKPMSEGILMKQGHQALVRRWGEVLAWPTSPEEGIKKWIRVN